MNLYRGRIGNVASSSALRKSDIVQIPEERQLSIIYDERFYSVKDRWGLGVVHDMAMFGAVRTQIEIVVNHKVFDTPKFNSKWGTPPDLAAILGCFEAKAQMISIMPDSKLVKLGTNGTPRVHEIAERGTMVAESRENRQKLLMLLHQVPDLLGAISKSGESLARVIWNAGDRVVRRRLYGGCRSGTGMTTTPASVSLK